SALLLVTAPTASQAAGSTSARGPGAPARVAAPEVDAFRSVRTYEPVAEPVRLRIPGAHVDTALQRLRRQPDATIAVPDNPAVAGWYAEGPRPGEPGPAVVLGHVDSASGPAVFYHLAELRPGAVIYVDRADGRAVSFRVTEPS